VDDHPVVRAGLTTLLGTQPGLQVVGSASSGTEALETLRTGEGIDLVLLDLRMPEMNGIDVLLAMRREGLTTHVIVLTSFETDEDIYLGPSGC